MCDRSDLEDRGMRFWSKYTKRESVQIGAGMVCRGEVALIVAQKGISVGLLSEIFFAPVVIMVLVTTLLSPIILKMLFAK